MNLSQYNNSFITDGWDSMKAIMTMELPDILQIAGMLTGHAKGIIVPEIAKLNTSGADTISRKFFVSSFFAEILL